MLRMALRQRRPASVHRVVDLACEIGRVLAGEPWNSATVIALRLRAVAGRAGAPVNRRTACDVLTVTHAARAIAAQRAHERGDVGDVFELGNDFMAGRHTFHAHVPTSAVPEVHDLPHEHAVVLPGDARNGTV